VFNRLAIGEKLLTQTKKTEGTIPISEFLSLRLYSDTRPHCDRIADLQKGLIFVYQGEELVGEGTGFGVPIARYQDKTYFPGSSTVQIFQKVDCITAIKKFSLDMIYELKFRKARIESTITRKLLRYLSELYQKHKHWRPILQQNLLGHFGVQTNFVRTKPVGHVVVTYRVETSLIHVKADFKLLKKEGLQKVFLLNEQSSKHFRKYFDSNGAVLFDKHIDAWDNVEADWTCIYNESGEVGFRLWNAKDAILRRGREFLEGTLDWVGLDYEIGPEKTFFEYDIEVLENLKQK